MIIDDEEFKKRKERAKQLRTSVGMITTNDLNQNANNVQYNIDNDFQSKLKRAKELRNSVGMITSKDLETQTIDNPEDEKDVTDDTYKLVENTDNIKEEETIIPSIDNIQKETNNYQNNSNKEEADFILNKNKLLQSTDMENNIEDNANANKQNSDTNFFSQVGKSIENLWLGTASGMKNFISFITDPQHTNMQETELMASKNKNIPNIVTETYKSKKDESAFNMMKNAQNSNFNNSDIKNSPISAETQKKLDNTLNDYTDAYGDLELNPIKRNLSKSIVNNQNKIANNVNEIENPIMKKIAELTPSAGNSLFGAGLSMVNPYLGMSYFMVSASGSYEAEGRNRGMNKEQARTYGTIMGWAEGMTEMLEIDNFIKGTKAISKGNIKEFLKNRGISMADNAIQEAVIDPIDELTANITSGKTKNDYSTSEGWKQLGADMLKDGFDGALSSLLMDGITFGIDSSLYLYNKIQNGESVTNQDVQTALTDIDNNKNIDTEKRFKESFEYQKNKLLNNTENVYTVVDKDNQGNIIGLTQAIGENIDIKNSDINITPVVVYVDGNYNVIDSQSGLKLDGTMYASKEQAIKGFEDKISNIDNATINNINNEVTKTKLSLIDKMQEIQQKVIENPDEVQKQNTINFLQEDKLFSDKESQQILNSYNINTKINNRPYLGQELNKIITDNIFTQNTNSIQTSSEQNADNLKAKTTSYTSQDIKKIIEPFNSQQEYTKNEMAEIWNNEIDKNNLQFVYDEKGNIKNYIGIEEDGDNLVVNQYDSNDNIVNSETISPKNGKFSSKSINNAIKKVVDLYDKNAALSQQENKNKNPYNIQQDIENFSKQVDSVLAGTFPKNDMLTLLSKTPKPLIDIGLTNLPITMTQKHLKTIINSEGTDKNANYHDLGIDIVKQLPNAINNPLDIIESKTRNDSIVLTTFLSDNKDRTIIASIKINGQGQINNIEIDTNVMTSAYGRNNYEKFMNENLKNGRLLYDIDRGVIKKVDMARLQLPRHTNLTTNNGSIINNSIAQKNTNVKNNAVINNKSTQKKEKNAIKIEDFGEKIGGARKDLETHTTTINTGKEVIHDYTVNKTENGYSVNFKGKILKDEFKTQEEAEQYILDFKENIKNNRAFVKENNGMLMTENNKYLIYLRNPRTLQSQYIGKGFNNKIDAENYAIALSIYLKENGKNLFRPQIQKVDRKNPNITNATKTTGENILNNFGFKGGEFGNWVKQEERQKFLNYAQDAFVDLAIALDINPQSLGQNGTMNIAFGARGSGITGAVAHFEPNKKVINMTRLKGAGSLAHEYGHSIDNYLSRVSKYDENGMITTGRKGELSDNLYNAMKNVVDAMKYNTSTNQEDIDKKNTIYEKGRKNSLATHLSYLDNVFNGNQTTYTYNRKTKQREQTKIKVTDEQKQKYQEIRKILLDGKLDSKRTFIGNSLSSNNFEYAKPIEDLKKLYKEVVGRKINDDTVYWLYRYGQHSKQVTEVKSESAFSKSAMELDKATGRTTAYFSKTEEMWARAFESYISDKLKSKGITDTYLVHSVNNNEYALFNPFPAGEEREKINIAFDNLIETMKNEKLFESTSNSDIRYMKKNTSNNTNAKAQTTIDKNIQKELHNRIQNAILNKNSRGRTYLGTVNNNVANTVKNLLGIEINNRRHTLADNDIRHMIKQHGNPIIEAKKGQIAITAKDIEKIPDIINNYDELIKGTENNEGKTIRYIKNYSNNASYVVEVVPEDSNALKIKTMWKKPVRVTNSQKTPSLTSKTKSGLSSSTSTNIIKQNQQNVKNDNIRFAKRTAKTDNNQRNAERQGAYIEQEIQKIEATGNWDNSIPPTKLTDIRKTIENYLGLGIKKGHFRQQAFAIYKGNRDTIRTKEYKDMDSILHETGHALDIGNRLKIDKETIADELLAAIDKLGGYEDDSRTIRLEEGFAEVIREYSVIPEQAKIDYPQTIAILEKLRQNDQNFNNFITKVQQQTYNYIHQNPRNRTLSNISIGEQTDKIPLTKAWIKQESMRNIFDKDYAVKSAVKEMQKVNGKTVNQLKASENAYYLTRLASGINDKLISMLSEGYIDENGKKLMPGLNKIGEILGNDSARYNDLRAYIVARRDTDYKAKTLKTGLRSMDTKAVIEQFKNDKQIQESSKIIYDTLNGVLQYAVNNGIITQENANSLKESNAFYVPMQRVLENRGNQIGRKGAVSDIIKQRTGSELDIKDVLENIITNSANIIQQVENNNILKALYKQGESNGITGTIYDVIDTPMIKIGTENLNTWKTELQKQGVNVDELDLDNTIDLFAPNNKVDTKNLITSFINDNGKRVYLQFNDELIFNSLMNMDKKFMSQVLKINSKMNMPLRYGATMANVGFAIPNMISDTAQASIYSTAGFIPVIDNALGVLDILASTNKTVRNFVNQVAPEYAKRINNLYSIYKQTGATSSTRLSQYRESSQNIMNEVYGTKNNNTLGIQEKYKPLKRLLDLLTYIPEISEQSTRFRVFEKNYDYYKKKVNNETDARILAALESRDATQDFGRTGNLTREINQLIPFSAARVGSSYTFAEKISTNPKQVTMRIAILTTLAMAIKAMGYDDDEIDELNQRKKNDNFVLKVGDNILTIKKPQGILRSMINLAEYIEDLATNHIEEGKEGERLSEWLNNAIMDNMPADEITGLVPNMVAPLIENAINKDFYYNTDIVKSYDLELPDSEQYYEYNSQLAIWLGKMFNYSPAKIDNLISGYFAGLGTSITDAMDYALGKAGMIAEQPEMGAEDNAVAKRFIVNVNTNSASIDEIYNRKTELTKKQNGGTITETETEELKKITNAISNLSKLNKQIKEIKKDLTKSGEEKAKEIKTLQQEKTDTARQALGKDLLYDENDDKIKNTYFYPTNEALKSNGYSLVLNSEQRKEYEEIASEYYKKYESRGLYNSEYLDKIKSKAKDYAKNQLFKKYKSQLTKTK